MIAGLPEFPLTVTSDLPSGLPLDARIPRARSSDVAGDVGLASSDFASVLDLSLTVEAKASASAPAKMDGAGLATEVKDGSVGAPLPPAGKSLPVAEAFLAPAVTIDLPSGRIDPAGLSQANPGKHSPREIAVDRSVSGAASKLQTEQHRIPVERTLPQPPIKASGHRQSAQEGAVDALPDQPVVQRRMDPASRPAAQARLGEPDIQQLIEGSQAGVARTSPGLREAMPAPDSGPRPVASGAEPVVKHPSPEALLEPARLVSTAPQATEVAAKRDLHTFISQASQKPATEPTPGKRDSERGRSEPLPGKIAKADVKAAQSPLLQVAQPAIAESAAASSPASQPPTVAAPAAQAPTSIQGHAEFRADTRIAPQVEQAIEQLAEARDTVRTARPEILVRHGEFGLVSMRLDAANGDLRATLAARDPGFVPAIQAALSERAVSASQESANTAGQRGQEQGTGAGNTGGNGPQPDARYGSSPGSSQGSHQPQSGHQRTAASEPDARERSGAGSTNSNGDSAGGVFA